MAVRTATRRWTDLGAFLREYPQTLRVGALVLPAGTLDGEPAPELKVDLVLPLVGRVGPLTAQVVASLPDGGVALRVPEMPPKVDEAIKSVFASVEEVKGYLLASGQVIAPGGGETEALRAKVASLEARLAALAASSPVSSPGMPTPTGGAPPADGRVVPVARPSTPPGPSPVSLPPPDAPRGLPVPDVSDRDAALSGSLADRSLRDAFMALAVERSTGLLTIRYKDRVRWGFWSKGGPVGWRTEPIDEQEVLGVLLWRAGSITKEQLGESLQIMERRGCRQGEALIEMGVITFPQLVVLLQKQAEFVLQRVMREREGSWAFHPIEDLPERFVNPPLRVANLLHKALMAHVKDLPAEELATVLRPWLDQYLWVVPGVEKTLEEMKLSGEEAAFVKIVQKTVWRLREVFSVSSLSRSATAAFVWCLHELNLIEFREAGSSDRINEYIAKDLQKRYVHLQTGTLFDRLDLHWICTGAEVEAAWKRLSAEYHPDMAARLGDRYRGSLASIHALMAEAYETLKVEKTRREYRNGVIERTKIEQSAEMLAKQGEMAIMKEASRDALACWGKAVELVPGNADYREGLGRARALPSA